MPETKDKPVFNEQALAKLLEAAYVLQEHDRELRAMSRRLERRDSSSTAELGESVRQTVNDKPWSLGDYASTLAQIVEAQHQIQARHLEVDDTLALVAERVMGIARGSGAAIGFLDGDTIRYKAASGRMTLPVGTEIPAEKALCSSCVRSGQVVRCEDVDLEFLLDVEECRRRGIQSMIAVPVYQVGGIAGGLELYYDRKRDFTEQDVHTCQLMAGLVTGTLARVDELTGKRPSASESSMMPKSLEKLRADLSALVDVSAGKAVAAATTPPFVCRKCGHELLAKEQFCGNCGSPRASSDQPPSQAPLRHTQEGLKTNAPQVPANGSSAAGQRTGFDGGLPEPFEEKIPEGFVVPGLRIREATFSEESSASVEKAQIDDASKPILAMPPEPDDEADALPAGGTTVKSEPVADWSSAAATRVFLEELAGQRPGVWTRFWNDRRGDVYLAIAAVLVACVIRWGIWSSHPVSATGSQSAAAADHRRPAPEDDLSLFDRMLVKLGLAEAPEPLESKGNPEIQVWVDLKTALYYCPGTDLYGKSAKGKFTTQRDAQLDQFEPAYRRACN